MSHTASTIPANTARGRAWFVAGILLMLAAVSSLAAATLPAEDHTILDLQHTLLARQALQQDALLAPLQIGVRVDKRIATLWGPVPSAELAKHAVTRLKELPELLAVRSELHVETPENPSAVLRPTHRHDLPEPAARPPEDPAMKLVGLGPPPPPEPRSAFDETEGIVLPAIRIPLPPGTTEPATKLEPSVQASAAAQSLEAAVQQLQRSDERYRRLQVEVHNAVVTLSGVVSRWEDMHALARTIARLPNVERVVLNSIRVDSNSR